ncbi:MAG TPA: ABC transporter substrate-binding protein [Candidatus Aquilonibacter sp.]
MKKLLPTLARVCAALLTVVLAGMPSAGRAQDAALKVATIPIDTGAEAFYALDQSFFKKAGLDVSIERISNGPAIAAAVASGAVDVGFSNLVSLAIAFKKGVPITLIAPAGMYSSKAPTTTCVVALNSPIKSAKDLNGKVFATNGLKNIGEFGPRAWIDKNGGDSATVKFVEMPFPDMAGALTQGRIDAAVMAEPTMTESKGQTRFLSNCYDGIGSNYLIGAYFATTSWTAAHPDLVRKFQAAIRETAIWANKNPQASAAILARVSKMNPDIAAKMYRAVYPERLEASAIQPVIDVTAKYGALPASFPATEMMYQGR